MIPRTRLLLAIGSMLLAVLALGAAPASGQLALEAQWGSPGSGDGQFAVPIDVAGDGAGHVYVVDPVLGRVEKFDSNGNFITAWSGPASPDGQSFQPFGVAVDRGTVYVSDLASDGIYRFD